MLHSWLFSNWNSGDSPLKVTSLVVTKLVVNMYSFLFHSSQLSLCLLQILVILGTPLVGRLGYFRIIRYNFLWKFAGGITMYFLIGPSNPWFIMLFILLDRCVI